MLYLVLIASLCIYRSTAQCTGLDHADCAATEGCEPITTGACTEGGPNCCEEVTPTPTTASPTTAEPTTAEPTTYQCPTALVSCDEIETAACCIEYADECQLVISNLCQQEGGGPGCCEDATPAPTTAQPTTSEPTTSEPTTSEPTTSEPTLAPTCPTDLDSCAAYTEAGCCPDSCVVDPDRYNFCTTEGGPGCCLDEETTTEAPETTEAETTESPETTEAETTEAETTEAETTEAETTEAETTESESEEESTTTETPEEEETSTTEESESESEEETSTTEASEEEGWPTPKPTMPSAEKWEMIHPAYKGSDGELLWHVYYGDFSNDDRFDSFRKAEQWNTKEIKPIIMHDKQFKKYRHANSKKFKQANAVVTDNNTGAQSYGSWLIGLSAVLIVLFAIWYKFGSNKINKNTEYTPLLSEEKVDYGN